MSHVLFVMQPYNGHVNPTLGLVNELVKQGEQVTYFCSEKYRARIEAAGATFKSYGEVEFYPSSFRNAPQNQMTEKSLQNYVDQVLKANEETIPVIMEQIKGEKFDYMILSSQFPLGKLIASALNIPTVSSFAVLASPSERMNGIVPKDKASGQKMAELLNDAYRKFSDRVYQKYHIKAPAGLSDLMYIKSDLNIVYTSKYFIQNPEDYDDSFIFIGPPIYDRKEKIDFPFEKLVDKKVVYISLGTVFNDTNDKLYDIFFKAFGDTDAVVVMTAYNIDISKFNIPQNFIVKNYVPQSKILKYTAVAVTNAGVNSVSDLIYHNIPFVAIPIGADQPYQAARVSELGAAISLDKNTLTPEILRDAVAKVQTDPNYLQNIKKIGHSFREAGGYPYAVEKIFALKKAKGIDC